MNNIQILLRKTIVKDNSDDCYIIKILIKNQIHDQKQINLCTCVIFKVTNVCNLLSQKSTLK